MSILKFVIFFIFITFLNNSFLYGIENYFNTECDDFYTYNTTLNRNIDGSYDLCFNLKIIPHSSDYCRDIEISYGCFMKENTDYESYQHLCMIISDSVEFCDICIGDYCDYYLLPDYIFWKNQINMIDIVSIGKNSVKFKLPHIDTITYQEYLIIEEYNNIFTDMIYEIFIDENFVDTYHKNDENYLIDQLEPEREYKLKVKVLNIYGEIMELETTFTTLPEEL